MKFMNKNNVEKIDESVEMDGISKSANGVFHPHGVNSLAVLSGGLAVVGTSEFTDRNSGESVAVLNLTCNGIPFAAFGKSVTWLSSHLPPVGTVVCRLRNKGGLLSLTYCALV